MSRYRDPLAKEVEEGDLTALRIRMQQDPNSAPQQGLGVLVSFLAPMSEGVPSAPPNTEQMLRMFVEAGAPVNAIYDNMTALGRFANVGHADGVSFLISKGALLDPPAWTTTYGHTLRHSPLMLAAAMGATKCMEILIGAGAQLEGQDEDGETAMAWSAREAELDAAKLLRAHGALVNVPVKSGPNPLHLLVGNMDEIDEQQMISMLEWLIEDQGLDPELPGRDGYSAVSSLPEECEVFKQVMLAAKSRFAASILESTTPQSPSTPRSPRL